MSYAKKVREQQQTSSNKAQIFVRNAVDFHRNIYGVEAETLCRIRRNPVPHLVLPHSIRVQAPQRSNKFCQGFSMNQSRGTEHPYTGGAKASEDFGGKPVAMRFQRPVSGRAVVRP